MPQGLEVQLHDMRAGGFWQAREDCGVRDRLEADELPPAEQTDGLALGGAPDDGSVGRAGVGGSEFERVGAHVIAASQPDGEAALGELAVLPEPAGLVAGALQRGEGLRASAGIRVAAGGCNVKLRRRGGQGEEERSAEAHHLRHPTGHDHGGTLQAHSAANKL